MAHFIGTIRGSRGEASRLAGKDAGIRVTARGWNVGVYAVAFHDEKSGEDKIRVTLNGGSNGRIPEIVLGEWSAADIKTLHDAARD